MKRILGHVLIRTLLILSLACLVESPATAGSISGQLLVGLTVVDTCSLATPLAGSDRLASLTGFGLHCTKGTTYSITVAETGTRQAHVDVRGLTRVTVRF